MDYISTLKKLETKRPTEYTQSAGKLPLKNKKFKKLIDDLTKYKEYVNKKTGQPYKVDLISDGLLDEMRLVAVAKHYEREEKKETPLLTGLYNTIVELASFRNYCGINTRIFSHISKNKDVNMPFKIDKICQMHDYMYAASEDAEDIANADQVMLKSILEQYVIGDYETTEEGLAGVKDFLINRMFYQVLPNIIKLAFTAKFVKDAPTNLRDYRQNREALRVLFAMRREERQRVINDVEIEEDIENYIKNPISNQQQLIEIDNDFRRYIERHAAAKAKAEIGAFWTGLGTPVIYDTIFTAIAGTVIGVKMLVEKMTGYQITSTIDEQTFDPFDIKHTLKQFVEHQYKLAEDANVDIEPFKYDDTIYNIPEETKKEQDDVSVDIDPVLQELYNMIDKENIDDSSSVSTVEFDPMLSNLYNLIELEEE
jgi:hypothetical protein